MVHRQGQATQGLPDNDELPDENDDEYACPEECALLDEIPGVPDGWCCT